MKKLPAWESVVRLIRRMLEGDAVAEMNLRYVIQHPGILVEEE